MTVENVVETIKRLAREKAHASRPEPTLMELLARESAKLGARYVPAKEEGE
jgi:hypothetical protein